MRVKLLISRATATTTQKAGDEIEVSEREAKRLMEAHPPKAVPVRTAEAVEHATREPAEEATPRPRKRSR